MKVTREVRASALRPTGRRAPPTRPRRPCRSPRPHLPELALAAEPLDLAAEHLDVALVFGPVLLNDPATGIVTVKVSLVLLLGGVPFLLVL
jgi:hypothetical protein